MNHVNVSKVGFVCGAFAGLIHLLWSILVGTGLAQGYLDFVFQLHFIKPFVKVAPFSVGPAVLLIVIALIAGYIFGAVLALIWNNVHAR